MVHKVLFPSKNELVHDDDSSESIFNVFQANDE